METYQTGILQPVPQQAVYLTFNLKQSINHQQAIEQLQTIETGDRVVGIGRSFMDRFNLVVPGVKTMPEFTSNYIATTSTPADLWCWLRGNDRGELLHQMRLMIGQLSPSFDLGTSVDAYKYAEGRDLTGYEDGTENPQDEAAVDAAICKSDLAAINGSSFVAVQQWLHDLDRFETFTIAQQDNIIGRRRSDNEELDDAPESAHVKRTAQESFDPEAFLLRRSMPWSRNLQAGLMFVAFGHSFDAFEAQFKRMTGQEDGIEDALFQFSSVLNGHYYWCPPMLQGRLNLAAINTLSD
jgi:putative iron-dependent peroxidase